MMKNRQDQLNSNDEIELMDLLVVLWRWKWLIIIGTIVCLIVAGIVTFNMPKIYRVLSSIEVGKVDNRFIEESPVISQKIKSFSMRKQIAQELSIPIEEISGEDFFKVSSGGSKNFLTITVKIETSKPERGIKILEVVNQTILKDHQRKVEEAKKELLEKIAQDEDEIKNIKTQIEALKKEILEKIAINENLIKIKEEKQKILKKQLLNIQKEVEALRQIRERISKRKMEKVDVIGMVEYFNDFQARLNSLYYTQSQIVDEIPTKIESYKENIATLQTRLVNLDNLPAKLRPYKNEITAIQEKIKKATETKVVDPPHSSLYPIKPQKKRILAITGVAGLVFFVFLAFLLDYIEKYRQKKHK